MAARAAEAGADGSPASGGPPDEPWVSSAKVERLMALLEEIRAANKAATTPK